MPMQLHSTSLKSSVNSARCSSEICQQASAATSDPTPIAAMIPSKPHLVEVIELTVSGTAGINAPPSTIWGRISRMTSRGAELAFGATAEANKPNIIPANVAITIVR